MSNVTVLFQKSKIKLAKELSDIVIYCKSVHFNGFEHAKDNQAFYEMSSFKESKALSLAQNSGKRNSMICLVLFYQTADSLHTNIALYLQIKHK